MTRRPRKHVPGAPRAGGRARRGAWGLALLGLLGLTFVAYLPSLDNGFTNWDDNAYVADNSLLPHPDLRAVLTTPVAGNYHPLTIWSLALNYRLSGLDPLSYHWLNLLLHLANTLLVFLFIRQLSQDRFWATVVTALFFGIHPMHVESVAWIAERKDVLYAFFYLLGLISYLEYVDRRRIAWLGAALLAFVLSVASKPAAVVFPVVLLAIDFYRRRPFPLRVALEKIPFFLVSILVGLASLQAQRATGALADARPWGLLQKALVASYGLMMYIVKLLVPTRLSAIYPHPNVAGEALGPAYPLALGLVVVGLPALVILFRRHRPVLFGLAFFLINIALVLQFFRVGGAVMADRYTYLPYVGLFFALAWWLDGRREETSLGAAARPVLGVGFALLVPVSLFGTWTRCDVWQNSETLWNDTIRNYPHRIYDAYINRGSYYLHTAKRLDAALSDFDQAIALNPGAAMGWLDKANAWIQLGQMDSAYVCLDRVLRINPEIPDAWNNRGVIKLRRGDAPGAVEDFSRTLELNPAYRGAHANRAAAYSMMREFEKSIADNRRAAEQDRANPDPHVRIGTALHDLGRYREAIEEYDEAIRLTPRGSAQLGACYLYRSYAWAALGQSGHALEDAREAGRLGSSVDPGYLRRLGG